MILRALRCLFAVLVFAALSVAAHANGVPVIYAPLVPASVAPGGAAFTLTVNGMGFVSGAVVNWNGSPRPTTFVSSSQVTASISAADIASTGTAIITVINPATSALSNGVFFQITSPTVGLAYQESIIPSGLNTRQAQPATADLNGDGKLDLVVPTFLNTVDILFGNGDGTFKPPVSVPAAPAGERIYSVVIADFNGDGKPDLVVSYLDTNVSPETTGISVVLGNGDGTFQPPIASAINPNNGIPLLANMLIAADVNGDGKLDLVSACQTGVCVALGNGDGTFTPGFVWNSPVNTSGGPKVRSVTIGDFNGDGKLDIAAVVQPWYLVVMLGNGDGTFGPPSLISGSC